MVKLYDAFIIALPVNGQCMRFGDHGSEVKRVRQRLLVDSCYCCSLLDRDIDLRAHEVPVLIKTAKRNWLQSGRGR
jgi:hypothetical protein